MSTAGAPTDLLLEVRPAERPSRWEWRLIDRADGSIFERALEYESPSAARHAGLERLAELMPAASPASAPPAPEPQRYLVIVTRQRAGVYTRLRRVFGEHGSVDVILDRRRAPRSAADATIPPSGWWIARACDRRPEPQPLPKSA
ncbi:MAG TPA: hypothetical protein VHZ49_07915 [Methylomirabilota bacterium]|jgi:hypothetical protein|nr:hypothetical protein [Methylomirabilota bacterium]